MSDNIEQLLQNFMEAEGQDNFTVDVSGLMGDGGLNFSQGENQGENGGGVNLRVDDMEVSEAVAEIEALMNQMPSVEQSDLETPPPLLMEMDEAIPLVEGATGSVEGTTRPVEGTTRPVEGATSSVVEETPVEPTPVMESVGAQAQPETVYTGILIFILKNDCFIRIALLSKSQCGAISKYKECCIMLIKHHNMHSGHSSLWRCTYQPIREQYGKGVYLSINQRAVNLWGPS